MFLPLENPNLIAYMKATEDFSNIILTVVNLDPHSGQTGYVRVPREFLRLGDAINLKLKDLMTDEQYTWTQEWNFVYLDPHKMPFHLFQVEIHESNM
jgi:starch synthase (maltosyl-transferring)